MASAPEFETQFNNDEQIINWKEEAAAIIKDVQSHVKQIQISDKLRSSDSNVYLNIRTNEDKNFCVHVSSRGFRVVSEAFDTIDPDKTEVDEEKVYETPYALLDKISPGYVQSFGNQLAKQLLNVQRMQSEFNEEDENVE